ncbi:hypothetical protein GVO57_06565 [Sphingomonas changnyeongensis]|uniref:Uncharacterized protein n=1 Tax=Sphingomonas changnyeongensis TaxID=2698679 RepID=A0A7Z2S9A0_9SPHN|nr:hypothetical protein [Sphingomonas changnyeongensis]QHL90554.1 hypothetical protein GVO57_06565 [Sphingomonas changnyeongensis]
MIQLLLPLLVQAMPVNPAPAAPAAIPPARAAQARCLAVLAIVANAQRSGVAAAKDLPSLEEDGARFAEVVGEAIVSETGMTREQVGALLGREVETVIALTPLPIAEARTCLLMARIVAPPPAPAAPATGPDTGRRGGAL